jgi:hypothetical protein
VKAFDEVLSILLAWEHLGSRRLENGAYLIGHVPHVAPEAYLHNVYAPLDDGQIDFVEENIGRTFPATMRAFYKRTNGIHLFSDALSISGHRESFVRTGDAAWQPYSIITPNTHERPENAPVDMVFFGFYSHDGSQLGMSARSPIVWRFAPDSATPLNEWLSFDEMLILEVQRLATLFDKCGREFDESAPTTP